MINNKLFFKLYHEIPRQYIYAFGDAVCLKTLRKVVKGVNKSYYWDDMDRYVADVLGAVTSRLNDLYNDTNALYPSEDILWQE